MADLSAAGATPRGSTGLDAEGGTAQPAVKLCFFVLWQRHLQRQAPLGCFQSCCMSRTRLDCHGVSEKRADVHVCSSAGTLGKNSAAKAESSNATRMAPVDAKYARALMRVWQSCRRFWG